MRRRRATILGLAAIGAMLAVPAVRADDTVTGEVVDLSCYLDHPETSKGASHKKCAETCAKKGLPMGLLTDDSQVFLLLEDHENPKGYATAIDCGGEDDHRRGPKVRRAA